MIGSIIETVLALLWGILVLLWIALKVILPGMVVIGLVALARALSPGDSVGQILSLLILEVVLGFLLLLSRRRL